MLELWKYRGGGGPWYAIALYMYINAGEAGGYVVVQGWASGPVRWYETHGRNVGKE